MTENMNIQWYPGHMTKTRRQIEADLRQVDAVCEIVDARIPISSRNPDIDSICGQKPRIIVLNRMDLADPAATKKWREYFRSRGMAAFGGAMLTVSEVRISPDLSIAKVYVSIFPSEKQKKVMETLEQEKKSIRGELGRQVAKQLRIVPELDFYLDTSLDYAEHSEELLKM